MVKEDELTEAKYSGKDSGMSFEKLDEKMQSWGRKKFGDRYARDLWRNELFDLKKVDPNDELERFAFDMHCSEVYDMLCEENTRMAEGLFYSERFWTKQWQMDCRQRQREKLFCHLETLCEGEAARQIQKQGVLKMATMREFLFKRFGAGQPEVLEARVTYYLQGMPDLKTGEVFAPRCIMEDKLDALEKEREFLLDMCPKDKRDTYEDGKITTLTRLILRTLPKEYDSAVKTVRDLHRFRTYGKDNTIGSITNLEDSTRRNYETEWLPNYDELRAELISSYNLQKRRRDQDNIGGKKGVGHPTLAIQGFEQPGPKPLTCYGCGQPGHRRGDPKCTAAKDAVWHAAPDHFKKSVKKVKGRVGKPKFEVASPFSKQRNLPRNEGGEKGICFNFSRGNGYCKFGDNCKYKHEGPKGGGKRNGGTSLILKTQKKRKVTFKPKPARSEKHMASMIMKDMKNLIEEDDYVDDTQKHTLYNLVRGEKSNLLVTNYVGAAEYRPKRPETSLS